jgi:hypothetical protein
VAGLQAIMEGIAASLVPLQVDGLQVTAFMNANPTPPSLDVYPGGPSGAPAAQGVWEEMFTVRARISTPDDVAAQQVLLSLMDAEGPTSVIAALEADPTFGGVVDSSNVFERSGFEPYPGPGGDWLGCEWRVGTL